MDRRLQGGWRKDEGDPKPLPNRLNMVVSRTLESEQDLANLLHPDFHIIFTSIQGALEWNGKYERNDVWFIGGTRIYAEAESYVDVIDATYVPDMIAPADDLVYLPKHTLTHFDTGPLLPHEDEPTLTRRLFTRRRPLYF